MNEHSKHEAAIPNPKFKPFSKVIGKWKTVGTHPYLPNRTLHGQTSFEWIEGGAFLRMRSEIDEPEIPSGIAVFGSDDASGEYFMIYFDERTVSRKYDVSWHDEHWKWWRNALGFSQRCTLTFTDDGRKMLSQGELSKDGSIWEKDLELIYTRVE